MKNKILVVVVALFSTSLFNMSRLSAQDLPFSLGLYRDNISVNSINGVTAKGVYRLQVNVKKENIYLKSIATYITSPIIVGDTKIEPEKISINLNKITGGITDIGNNHARFILSDAMLTPIIMDSNTELQKHTSYVFHFDITVQGGDYLSKLIPHVQYPLGLTFLVSASINDEVSTTEISVNNIDFRIAGNLSGSYRAPDFGFQVNANSTLDFSTPENYMNGVRNLEGSSWLSVNSKQKGYVIKVQTWNTHFTGNSGDIPVGVVSMNIKESQGNSSGPEVKLSNNEQVVFNGYATGENAHRLNVNYFTKEENANTLLQAKKGVYTTTLMYTLEPR